MRWFITSHNPDKTCILTVKLGQNVHLKKQYCHLWAYCDILWAYCDIIAQWWRWYRWRWWRWWRWYRWRWWITMMDNDDEWRWCLNYRITGLPNNQIAGLIDNPNRIQQQIQIQIWNSRYNNKTQIHIQQQIPYKCNKLRLPDYRIARFQIDWLTD